MAIREYRKLKTELETLCGEFLGTRCPIAEVTKKERVLGVDGNRKLVLVAGAKKHDGREGTFLFLIHFCFRFNDIT